MTIAVRLTEVKKRMAEAAVSAGRDPSSVRLVAVSKLQPATRAAEAVAAGQLDLGENYAQELREKAQHVTGARWHMIGPLQRNKARHLVGITHLLHTLDHASLIDEVARRAEAAGLVQPCLIQVDIGAEAQKSGCSVDDVPTLTDRVHAQPSLRLDGYMCIPPVGTPEATRPYFRAMARLAEDERQRTGQPLPDLSMGMTSDFAVAIAEGATIVRIGTAIFGQRT